MGKLNNICALAREFGFLWNCLHLSQIYGGIVVKYSGEFER